MALVELPLQAGNPNFEFKTDLDGVSYAFRFRYNTRAMMWAMDLKTAVGSPILMGIAIRLGLDLLAPYKSAHLPPGHLFAVNYSNPYQEPGLDNFGTDVAVSYQGVNP